MSAPLLDFDDCSESRNDNATRERGEVGKADSTTREFCHPDPMTVKGRTLGALLRGERLSHLDCWRRFGSARLSHHIYMLRGIGWDVQMTEETVTTSDAGRPASIGIYWLSPDAIAEAGERGQQYAADCASIEAQRRAA